MSSIILNSENYLNRELAWLEFNGRVLEEAQDSSHPLLERAKFLSIVSSNLDEFFEIRVAGLKQQEEAAADLRMPDDLTPGQQLKLIAEKAQRLVERQYASWREELVPALRAQDLVFLGPEDLNAEDREWASRFFEARIYPVLTPLAIDPAHPFPFLPNKSLNLALALVDRGRFTLHERLGLVPVPRSLPNFIQLPGAAGGPSRFMFLEDLMGLHVEQLFPGQACLGIFPFRVTRNSNLYLDEDEAENLLEAIENELQQRRRGEAVRLEIKKGVRQAVLQTLVENLKLLPEEVYEVDGPIDLQRLKDFYQAVDRPALKDVAYTPPLVNFNAKEGETIFNAIRHRDILMHHPYESFGAVVDFLSTAAEDPDVLAIKQTLYRTSNDSPVISALVRAAENRKQVTVLMELKARFDEENNITLARRLEEAGVHVVYGLVGLKTHSKVVLVVRQEGEEIRRYVHLGTGNYNPTTAKVYTDLGLLSCRPDLGKDVASLFNMLTGFSSPSAPPMKKLLVAPMVLGRAILQMIERETEHAQKGKPARIIAKMNALVDPDVVAALYEASQAGVEIELLVRGTCCLKPGLPGISENIRVRSIVDRFLEHSRIYYFENGGSPQVWLGSADWMPRNFLRRVEVLFPLEDRALKQRVVEEILAVALADNVKARMMNSDGTYSRLKPGEGQAPLRSQQVFIELAQGKAVAVPPLPPCSGSKQAQAGNMPEKLKT